MAIKKSPVLLLSAGLLLLDALLTSFIVVRVPYTKIDWDAYMSQVTGFLKGERDYTKLNGDTGPLVYPAGFLYIYSAIQRMSGGAVFPAQILFGALYLINLGLVFILYTSANVVPLWTLPLLCLSKRIHSIFVLRLFNDAVATTLTHASMVLLQKQRWYLGLIIFSLGVSVKMNVLLYAPALLLLLLKGLSYGGVLTALSFAAIVQILLGMPFLLAHPMSYISRAFDLGRVFVHFWSVNFKFVPEQVFLSKQFAVILMMLHLGLLFMFAQYKWCKNEGGLLAAVSNQNDQNRATKQINQQKRILFFSVAKQTRFQQKLSADHILTVLFTGNFIGIICARSLHYQFYSWYFYSLPFLLWKTPFPTTVRLGIFAVVETCWNIYPSNIVSAGALLVIHAVILWGLWLAKCESPYVMKDEKDT